MGSQLNTYYLLLAGIAAIRYPIAMKAAKTFMAQALKDRGYYPPKTVMTDNSPTCTAIIKTMEKQDYSNLPSEH